MVTIIDYGVGNLKSIQNMLHRCNIDTEIASDINTIQNAKKIILPGVGAFDTAMDRLRSLHLIEVLQKCAATNIPLLGICLGAQLLFDGSEEGQLEGLGLIKGYCKKFDSKNLASLRVPHMGWSEVQFKNRTTFNISDLSSNEARFYFVHSYYFNCADDNDILATANYGGDFTCAIQRKNVIGVQFHPEKSHKFGVQFFRDFASL